MRKSVIFSGFMIMMSVWLSACSTLSVEGNEGSGLSSKSALTQSAGDSDKVQLYFAKTEVVFDSGTSTFFVSLRGNIQIAPLNPSKVVRVHYSINHGSWASTPAYWVKNNADGTEVWGINILLGQETKNGGWVDGPYDVEFAIEYQVNGASYWDNNGGFGINYKVGTRQTTTPWHYVALSRSVLIQESDYYNSGGFGGSVFLKDLGYAKAVKIVYTTDRWAHTHVAGLQYIWSPQPGIQGWDWYISSSTGTLISDTVEYAISYEVNGVTIWDNNFGRNYTTFRR